MRCEMHLVLNRLEKPARRLGAWIVVNAGGVDIQHLAIENLF
jgi:hypothetical protein